MLPGGPRNKAFLAVAAWLLALALLLAGCGQPEGPAPVKPSPDGEVKALMSLGAERAAKGEYDQAADAFRAALNLPGAAKRLDRILMQLARSEAGAGHNQKALAAAQRLVRERPSSPLVVEAMLLAGGLETGSGRHQAAVARLGALLDHPPRALTTPERKLALGSLIQSLAYLNRYEAAVNRLLDLYILSDPTEKEILKHRLAKLAGNLKPAHIRRILGRTDFDEEVRPVFKVGLAKAQLGEGRLDEASRTLGDVSRQSDLAPVVAGIREEIAHARMVNPRAVGVILPLSGPYKEFGNRVLVAVQLGLGLFGQTAAHPATLYIEDSKGDPRTAAEAVRRLVEDRKVSTIIGPIMISTSLAASLQAEKMAVPLINLSRAGNLTQGKNFVFQSALLPQEEVAALLGEVLYKRDVKDFAALAPNNPYGKGFVAELTRQLAPGNGRLVRAIYYDPAKTDYSAEVKRLVKLPPGNYRPGLPDSPKPVIDFGAVFLPDSPQRIGIVLAQLAYYDVVGVWVMGTNLWQNSHLQANLKVPTRYLQGTIYPAGFDTASSDPLVRGFVEDFKAALGSEPQALESRGFDAGLLLKNLLDRPNPPRTRAALRDSLAGLVGVKGLCGLMSMDQERRVACPLLLRSLWRKGEVAPQGPAKSDDQAEKQGAEAPQAAPGRVKAPAAFAPPPTPAPRLAEAPAGPPIAPPAASVLR